MASKVEAISMAPHGTLAQKCTGTQVLLGFTPLVWQISAWPSHIVTSFESPAQRWTAERNYPEIEQETLSLVYGIRKFHQYLNERKFVLVTDYKPLTTLLGPKKSIPPLAVA